MSARILEIADLVVAEINAATFSDDFTATRDYVPQVVVAPEAGESHAVNIELPRVAVVPQAREPERLSRNSVARQFVFYIGFYQRINVTDGVPVRSEVDAMVQLVQEVEDFYNDAHLLSGSSGTALAFSASTPQVYDFDALRVDKEFRSYVRLVVREVATHS